MKEQSYSSEYSAGGVVCRKNGEGTDIALIYRTRHDDWSLPKGHIEEGESREQAALREIKEETGIDARIIAPLGESVYFYRRRNGDLIRKSVYHFLMEALSTKLGKPNWEVTEARWVPITEAQALLSYQKDKDIVAKAASELDATKDERRTTKEDQALTTDH